MLKVSGCVLFRCVGKKKEEMFHPELEYKCLFDAAASRNTKVSRVSIQPLKRWRRLSLAACVTEAY